MNCKKFGRAAASMALVLSVVSTSAMAAPADLMGHDSLYVWDYHLTNYDKNGSIRVTPEKTTFALPSDQQDSGVPAYFAPDAVISETGGGGYGVSGQVEIQLSYESERDRAWVDAIRTDDSSSVQLVSFDENKRTVNAALGCSFEIGVKSSDGKHTVAKLTIPLGQSNFYSNGRYYVRVRAEGKETALIPIHVVNDKAPTITPQLDPVWTTEPKAFFDVSDMTYGVLMPAYAAELTYPDGTTKPLTIMKDWYLIGNLFVLYNDNEKEALFTQLGTYTLTVHSTGFKDMSCTFEMEKGQPIPGYTVDRTPTAKPKPKPVRVDAVSRATGGGSGSGGEGSMVMPANIIFNEDLLSNAQILGKLGLRTPESNSINRRWSFLMKNKWDAVYDADRRRGYDWMDYMDAVQRAKKNGEYLTFEEYAKHGKLSGGNPYAIKEVLEDGLLGETQMGGVYLGKLAPNMELIDAKGQKRPDQLIPEGEDMILSCDDAAYLKAITGIMVDDHQFPRLEEGRDYKIDDNRLTVYGRSLADFDFGPKRITLDADGYRRTYLNIVYGKNLEQNVQLEAKKPTFGHDEAVFVRLTNTQGDFMKHLQKVEIIDPKGVTTQLLTKDQGGDSSNDWYTVNDNTTIGILPGAFTQNGTYTVQVTAKYYGMRSTKVELTGELPEIGISKVSGTRVAPEGTYQLTLNEENGKWRLKKYQITVNGIRYLEQTESDTLRDNMFCWNVRTENQPVLYLSPSAFSKEQNEILITLEGYAPVRMLVDAASGYAVMTREETMPEGKEAPAFDSAQRVTDTAKPDHYRIHLSGDAQDYLNAIGAYTKVTVQHGDDTKTYQHQKILSGKHSFAVQDGLLELTADGFQTGKNTVTIAQVGGFKPLTFTVTVSEEAPSDDFDARAQMPTVEKKYGYYMLNYKAFSNEAVAEWLRTVTGVQVNETPYTSTEYASSVYHDTEYNVYSEKRTIYLGAKAFQDGKDNTIVLTDGKGTIKLRMNGSLKVELVQEEESSTVAATVAAFDAHTQLPAV